ncbi:two-component sensor histidine kinase [Streptomyces bathyalis]|uniref:histidine kinase n=1 Tax=Streptomyces bathyalis TaxID=2710756 RepID=A0A7T1TC09_9ACTN|nr:sensor histidine kinase [Streptomyces bathyalis]QPP10199.1 two-component sensor histidine kinase [Streptomyces bathyalis]
MGWREHSSWVAYGRYGLVVLVTFGAVQYRAVSTDGGYLTPGTAAAVLCGLFLLVRRPHWLLAPLLATAATGLWGWPMLPLLLIALFDLAASHRVVVAMGCGAAVLVTEMLLSSATSSFTERFSLLLLVVVGCGHWAGRGRQVKVLNAQVEHLRIERELREEAARAAERSRIAAEMHDVLAHRLSLIALHTGVLTATTSTLPQVVGERLTLLRTTSTDALADLRDILGALHGPRDATADAASAPVLRDVHELVDEARTAGQQVEMTVDGQPGEAPTVHRLAVHRLVQEALTNARKHAEGAQVTVRIDYGPPVSVVEVTNGPGSTATETTVSSGFGLVGLRERVTTLGGRLHAGPHDAGSWRLAARIPHPTDVEQNGIRT